MVVSKKARHTKKGKANWNNLEIRCYLFIYAGKHMVINTNSLETWVCFRITWRTCRHKFQVLLQGFWLSSPEVGQKICISNKFSSAAVRSDTHTLRTIALLCLFLWILIGKLNNCFLCAFLSGRPLSYHFL